MRLARPQKTSVGSTALFTASKPPTRLVGCILIWKKLVWFLAYWKPVAKPHSHTKRERVHSAQWMEKKLLFAHFFSSTTQPPTFWKSLEMKTFVTQSGSLSRECTAVLLYQAQDFAHFNNYVARWLENHTELVLDQAASIYDLFTK